MAAQPAPLVQPVRGPRLRQTCDSCVKRKIHCDGSPDAPCARCVRISIPCTFTPLRTTKSRPPRSAAVGSSHTSNPLAIHFQDIISLSLAHAMGGQMPVNIPHVFAQRTIASLSNSILSSMSVLPREVTIFDGLPPAPSSTTMNNLITRYFVRKPELMLIHRSTFLSSPAQNPILAYSALAFAGASHEDPEVRNAARRVFYPRLQRLIRAEWESPSLETVIGMMHAEMLASHWKLWDQAYYLRARVAFSVTYLRLHSDDFDPRILNSPMGAYDPWILQETARRVYWMAMTMDGTVAASTKMPKLMSSDDARTARFPSLLSEWNAPADPTSTRTTMPTLGELLTPPNPKDPLDASISVFFDLNCLFSSFGYLFGRMVDFHRYCLARTWLPFRPPDGAPERRVRALREEIEEDLHVWKRRCDDWAKIAGADDLPVHLVLVISWHSLWTVLHGPTVSLIAFGYEVLTPVEWRSSKCFPKMEAEEALEAWCSSPSFVTAVSHAFEASNILETLRACESRFRKSPASWSSFFLGQIAVIILFPALRMQQEGLDIADMEKRSRTIVEELYLLEGEAGPSVVFLITALVDEMLKRLRGTGENFEVIVNRLFVPAEEDRVGDI